MKKIANGLKLLTSILLFTGYAATAQTEQQTQNSKTQNKTEMKTFVIEREIPDAGKLTPEQLKAASKNSCSVLTEMGPDIIWDHSYVTANKIYCVYKATNAELIREHARKAGLPANSISEVGTVISPATAK
ncbi:MAG TPA: DUF4242 domain-containing protein [Ferruginibacter sp.]|nr:DUF4242 domain-containing protein [Ferruginibacter sp.]